MIPSDPITNPPKNKYVNHKTKFSIDKSIKNINIKVEADANRRPLAAEAKVIANTTSDDDKGLCTTSVIVPMIFPIIKDELE